MMPLLSYMVITWSLAGGKHLKPLLSYHILFENASLFQELPSISDTL